MSTRITEDRAEQLMRELGPIIAEAGREAKGMAFTGSPVFIGGSVVGLLVDRPPPSPISSTKDLDVLLSVANRVEFGALEAALRRRGFRDSPDHIGRFYWGSESIVVDFLTATEGLGFSDKWYPAILDTPIETRGILHAAAPAFLATKFSAFQDRGRRDLLSSKDLEDILAVVEGRATVVTEVTASPGEVRSFLALECMALLSNTEFLDNFFSLMREETGPYQLVDARLREIGRFPQAYFY